MAVSFIFVRTALEIDTGVLNARDEHNWLAMVRSEIG